MATTDRGYPLFAQTDSADIATKLNAISQTINDDVESVVQGPTFTALTLAADLVPFSATPRYALHPDNTVVLRGNMQRSGGINVANSAVLATLPTAIRPAESQSFAVATSHASGATAGRVDIQPSGTVQLWLPGADTAWVALDGIRYRLT